MGSAEWPVKKKTVKYYQDTWTTLGGLTNVVKKIREDQGVVFQTPLECPVNPPVDLPCRMVHPGWCKALHDSTESPPLLKTYTGFLHSLEPRGITIEKIRNPLIAIFDTKVTVKVYFFFRQRRQPPVGVWTMLDTGAGACAPLNLVGRRCWLLHARRPGDDDGPRLRPTVTYKMALHMMALRIHGPGKVFLLDYTWMPSTDNGRGRYLQIDSIKQVVEEAELDEQTSATKKANETEQLYKRNPLLGAQREIIKDDAANKKKIAEKKKVAALAKEMMKRGSPKARAKPKAKAKAEASPGGAAKSKAKKGRGRGKEKQPEEMVVLEEDPEDVAEGEVEVDRVLTGLGPGTEGDGGLLDSDPESEWKFVTEDGEKEFGEFQDDVMEEAEKVARVMKEVKKNRTTEKNPRMQQRLATQRGKRQSWFE